LDYLHLLKLTAELSVDVPVAMACNGLESILREFLGTSGRFGIESLRRFLGRAPETALPVLDLTADLSDYDGLLETAREEVTRVA
jgi:hypothetical protein